MSSIYYLKRVSIVSSPILECLEYKSLELELPWLFIVFVDQQTEKLYLPFTKQKYAHVSQLFLDYWWLTFFCVTTLVHELAPEVAVKYIK